MSTLPALTADTLLTAGQVAQALRWRPKDARAWLEGRRLFREHPDGRRKVVRWGDVLEAMPREGEPVLAQVAPLRRLRRNLARGSY